MSREKVSRLSTNNKVSIQFRNSFMVKHLMQNYDNQGSFVKIDGNNIFVVRQQDKIIKQSNFRSHSMHNENKNTENDRAYLIQQDTQLQPIKIESLMNPQKFSQSPIKLQKFQNQTPKFQIPKHIKNTTSQQFKQMKQEKLLTGLQKYYYKRNIWRTVFQDSSSSLFSEKLKQNNPLVQQSHRQININSKSGQFDEVYSNKQISDVRNTKVFFPKIQSNLNIKSNIKDCQNEIERFDKGIQHSEEDNDFDEYVNALKLQ